MAQVIFNSFSLLYLSYLMLLFTDFTDYEIQHSAGNQFLYATLTNIGINLVFGLIPPTLLCYKRQKYYRFKFKLLVSKITNKKKREVKETSSVTVV